MSPAHPEGYDLIPDVVEVAKNNAKASGDSFRQVTSMEEAFKDADIVYPKSWAPYKVMEERTELLRANDHEGLKALEKQCLAQNAQHKDWHCTEEMMELTRDGEALYMHCLPADISGVSCKEGEVTEGVFEKYRIATYKEASWKPYIIAAMILSRKYAKPCTARATAERSARTREITPRADQLVGPLFPEAKRIGYVRFLIED